MSIDQHVAVNITVNNAGISRQGFGTIGIMSYKTALFAGDDSLTFTSFAAAVTAGFTADSPEGLAIASILKQAPHVPSVKLLLGSLPPTQRYVISIVDAVSGRAYVVKVKGEGVTATTCTYTAGGGDDVVDIADALVILLNAVVGKNYLAVADGSDPDHITVTATVAGNWFSLELASTAVMEIAQTHADPGIATDLAAIQTADADWYYLHTFFNSEACVLAAANFIEATPFKAYIVDFVDSASENTNTGDGGLADQLDDLTLKRTLHAYHRKPNEMWAAGWEGRLAPLNVGKWTAAYKTITGSTADRFTATQIAHLDSKKCSYYKTEAQRNITWEGKVGNTDYGFLDVTVSLDFVLDDVQKSIYGILVAMDKVSFTDEDIQLIVGAAEGAIDRAKSNDHKIIAKGTPGDPDDPEPTVSWPKVKDIDPSARALFNLPGGNINFRLQGAVHTVAVSLTVSF